MSRSSKKGPYIDERLMKKVETAKSGNRGPIKTWSRACSITPEMVGITFQVHNGKDFIAVFVSENMVGHKLGEFSHTRKFRGHGGKMAKEQAKAASTAPAPATTPAAKPAAKGGKKK
ncbi:MAG: 30S ribosomal protein S19 [bacterium]